MKIPSGNVKTLPIFFKQKNKKERKAEKVKKNIRKKYISQNFPKQEK
jgi:hypothetical protein